MSRSSWKIPFVDGYLLKKASNYHSSQKKTIVKIWSRRSVIIPQFIGVNFAVHNGKKFNAVFVTENMVGHKLGEFSLSRTYHGHSSKDKNSK